ncbi:MAG: hypothetical protein IPG53_03530 [Ignavibacteriales bacterium]|nr:hypothetical protein [Ignavibacteriales bacterium]
MVARFERFLASVQGINLLYCDISLSAIPNTFAVSLKADLAQNVTVVEIIATLS